MMTDLLYVRTPVQARESVDKDVSASAGVKMLLAYMVHPSACVRVQWTRALREEDS